MTDKVMFQEQVREIMSKDVVSLRPESTLEEAFTLMAEKSISFIVVTTEGKRPIGVITERDIVRIMTESSAVDSKLRTYMSSPVLNITADENVFNAIHKLFVHNIRHFVVVDESGVVVGVLTLSNFLERLGFEYFIDIKEAKEIMKKKPLSITKEATVADAALLMVQSNESGIVVLEEEEPVGIFTERDVIRFHQQKRDLKKTSLGEVMSSPVRVIMENTNIFQIMMKLRDFSIRHLPVVNAEKQLVGIINQKDITKGMEIRYTGFLQHLVAEKENALREAHRSLEENMKVQTKQLQEANAQLEKEVGERIQAQNALQKANEELERVAEECARDLKKAREDLSAMGKRFHIIFENSPFSIAISDAKGEVVLCNPSFQKMMGYTEKELKEKKFESLLHPEDDKIFDQHLQEVLLGNVDHFLMDTRFLKNDESILTGVLTLFAIRNPKGAVSTLVSLINY